MDVFQKQTGKVLGPQGSVIKEMQMRFGVKLNIQVSESAKAGQEGAINKLKMSGTVDAVRAAKQCVNYILSGGALESYNFPPPANQFMSQQGGGGGGGGGNNQFMGQQMNQNNNQFGFNKPPVPAFGQSSYYPPALTPAGYGQGPPMGAMSNQSTYQPPMNQNQVPQFQNNGPNYQNNSAPNNYQSNQNPPNNYATPMAQNQNQNPTPSYRPQQAAPVMPVAAPQGASLGLGADGTSGVLEPPSTQPDGSHQQIANVRSDVLGKIIGKAGVNITLIKTKSGANVHVVKTPVPDPSGYTKVMMAGAAADVYLATQMIQEVRPLKYFLL